ncbi:TadE/TadG family type IV pilus assembly protein [Shewanella septentrionalis]|uniref:Pilus assembly protein n=1 Tax=Shewanella septentrionalis TaxID=2952223 RepID=A0A9X2WVN9_9GAMM|nr:pilus assembly protein [Shewanella septentrionalis]
MKRYFSGQSLTEFLVLMPIFFLVLCGILEFTYIYRAKTTLNTATFEAARAGSLNNAQLDPMREALRKGMVPLYMQGGTGTLKMGEAYIKVRLDEAAMNKASATVTIVHPTIAVFDTFKVKRKTALVNDTTDKERWIIPNDSLLYRSAKKETVKIAGKNESLNIQDANLLKVKTLWCYKLKVPILRELLVSSLGWFGSPEQRACNALGALGGPRLALSSQSTIRMQSHIVSDGNLK